jgi:large subunit ribosomal protein L29
MAESQMKEFAGKSKAELTALIADYKRELMNLRFQKVAGQLENPARFRQVRTAVARAYTEMNKAKK